MVIFWRYQPRRFADKIEYLRITVKNDSKRMELLLGIARLQNEQPWEHKSFV